MSTHTISTKYLTSTATMKRLAFSATMMIMLLLATVSPTVDAQGLMNDRCDDEICVCKVKDASKTTTCPEWMNDGAYGRMFGSPCVPADDSNGETGVVVCQGWVTGSIFTETPAIGSSCVINPDGSAAVISYTMSEGNSTVLMDYNEQNPMPDCPEEVPFTLMPSMMPTISPSPTSAAPHSTGLVNTLSFGGIAMIAVTMILH